MSKDINRTGATFDTATPSITTRCSRRFFDCRHAMPIPAPWKGQCSEVPNGDTRPAAAVECPGREAKGRRDDSERFPIAGQAGLPLETISESMQYNALLNDGTTGPVTRHPYPLSWQIYSKNASSWSCVKSVPIP